MSTLQKIILMMVALTYALLANEAILSINTGGHTTLIRDIIVTKSGDIISASDDKSIRVWDSRSGKEKRKILGEIGAGNGQIFAIALSPDEKYLAVSGMFGSIDDLEHLGVIRIYDYNSGKLIKLLESHKENAADLTFSNDGVYLLSGSADLSIKLWSMKDMSLVHTIGFHTDIVSGIRFGKNNTILSVGYDNRIAMHSFDGKLLESYTHTQKLQFIATNGEEIAVCGFGNEILIFDMALNLKSKIQSETVPTGLSYSPNKKYLIAGTGINPNNVNIYDVKNNHALLSSFKNHTNATHAVGWLDNQRAVSGGGESNEIYIWDRDSKEVKTKIVGLGQMVWSVGVNGDNIAWGNVPCGTVNCSKIEKSFNLKSLRLSNSASESNFTPINSDGLTHSRGGSYGDTHAVLNIASTGAIVTKYDTNGARHLCYGFYKDFIISGGDNGFLKIYDKMGNEVVSLVGHTGEVRSIALDGDRLISGSGDQTIKIWDLKPLEKIAQLPKEYDEKIINLLIKATNRSREEIIQQASFFYKEGGLNLYKSKTLQPTLSLFVGTDNEWIMWTPEGFFDASKDGVKYIGYHINQGADKEADFIGIDTFYDTFYRPDIVSLKLAGEDISKYSTLTIMDALKNLPPKVEVTKVTPKGDGRVNMCYKANSYKNGGIGEVRLYHNGKLFYSDGNYQTANDNELKSKKIEEVTKSALYEKRSLKVSSSEQMGASVSSVKGEMVEQCHDTYSVNGENEYVALAYNKTNTISSELAKANYTQKGSVHKPKLYVVAIGINEFISSKDNLKYAVKDAQDFSKKIKERAKTIFEQNDIMEPIVLIDKMATKANITQTINSLASKVHPEDRVVIFSASHGIVQDGSYYMITHDYKGVIEDGSMIGSNEFVDMTKNLPSFNQLIILDTCHAGGMDKIINGLYDSKIGRLAKKTGMHIYASANSKQEALDGYKENGLFTHTLLKGLDDDSADLRKRGVVSVSDLGEYSKAETNKISKELGTEQTPTIINFGNDIDICKVNGK